MESIDGVGLFDLISRKAMLQALSWRSVVGTRLCLLRQFPMDDHQHMRLFKRSCVHMHASGFIHHGKSQHWNRGGCEPAGVAELTSITRLVELDAVWKSDPELPLPQNGFLGAPIGHSLLGRRFIIFRESLIGSQTSTMTERANTVATGQDHSSWANSCPW